MTATTQTDSRKWLKHCLENGVRVWISYGVTEIEGWVLSVSKYQAEVQDATSGHIQTIAIAAIDESVEAC